MVGQLERPECGRGVGYDSRFEFPMLCAGHSQIVHAINWLKKSGEARRAVASTPSFNGEM